VADDDNMTCVFHFYAIKICQFSLGGRIKR